MKPYSSFAVANFFLALGERDSIVVSPMKLQKLVFYAQGWHLAFADRPLIDEQIECWKYGPVIRSLFHEFKKFGSDAITTRATIVSTEGDLGNTGGFRIMTDVPEVPATDLETIALIEAVWSSYKDVSAIKLSNMTHAEGEPWRVVYDQYGGNPPKGTDIPMELIQKHFRSLLHSEAS